MKRATATMVAGLLALAAAVPAAAHIPLDKRVCVVGVSKQMCAMRLFNGNWGPYTCVGPDQNQCQTLTGLGATFSGPITNEPGSVCDETGTEWQLTATVDVNVRGDQPLPVRGSLMGRFQLTDPVLGTLLAQGNISSTLGVGTHRKVCGDACGKDCETCYDARFDGVNTWVIGSEGFMDGEFTDGRFRGCRIRWSYQGEFTALGDANGPFGPAWGFCGNLDGVLECPCSPVP